MTTPAEEALRPEGEPDAANEPGPGDSAPLSPSATDGVAQDLAAVISTATPDPSTPSVADMLKAIIAASKVQAFPLPVPPTSPQECLRAAQESLVAAETAAQNALYTALLMNRVDKASRGVASSGAFNDSAQDALRSALLFAGAGLDQSLKRLAQGALPALIAEGGVASEKFQQWATQSISHPESGGVDPKRLVDLLVGSGRDPRDVLINRYVQTLTYSSAQSVDRVEEIASALGVVDKELRKLIAPGGGSSKALRAAFDARNQVSHELDLLPHQEGARKPFQRRRRSRAFGDMWDHANICLQVTQLVINDVSSRMSV